MPDDAGRLTKSIREVLQDVIDPEIGGSVVDIGLIYAVEKRGEALHVLMTTTTRGCPAAQFLVDAVKQRILDAGLADRVEVELTYDPPWSPDMMRK
ncbi:metal-sulfur cluster assembly factor [Rhizobium sp. KVB221]|uniref:Metal-sulfur cluster assembly factor n=1 Tax=Rhizobium setariae TaxID=2801340 RepID=A0A936YN35_9HYPH|nr:metal-sulfur cluster assembly factor [Rhizobium setariae]MBL0373574.1 metal-sulfur cluster assembly factor [Rhizobium setariae]